MRIINGHRQMLHPVYDCTVCSPTRSFVHAVVDAHTHVRSLAGVMQSRAVETSIHSPFLRPRLSDPCGGPAYSFRSQASIPARFKKAAAHAQSTFILSCYCSPQRTPHRASHMPRLTSSFKRFLCSNSIQYLRIGMEGVSF